MGPGFHIPVNKSQFDVALWYWNVYKVDHPEWPIASRAPVFKFPVLFHSTQWNFGYNSYGYNLPLTILQPDFSLTKHIAPGLCGSSDAYGSLPVWQCLALNLHVREHRKNRDHQHGAPTSRTKHQSYYCKSKSSRKGWLLMKNKLVTISQWRNPLNMMGHNIAALFHLLCPSIRLQ